MKILFRTLWHKGRHHLYAATIVASIVTVLHHQHLLAWLEVPVLRIASVARSEWLETPASPGIAGGPPGVDLVTLVISPSMFETDFGLRSPLDRRQLAYWIDRVAGAGPRLLVLDFDLSPGPGDVVGPIDARPLAFSEDYRRLQSALTAAASKGVRLVLGMPLRVQTEPIMALKFDWMGDLCGRAAPDGTGAIQFAAFEVTQHQNAVLRYDPESPRIGVVAAEFDPAAPAHGHVSHDRGGKVGQICSLVRLPNRAAMPSLIGRTVGPEGFDGSRGNVQYRYFNARAFSPTGQWIAALGCLGGADPGGPAGRCAVGRVALTDTDLRGKVVFMGSGANDLDQMWVPLAGYGLLTPGVAVHAATYFSERHPVGPAEGAMSTAAAFVADVVVGIVTAELFGWLWAVRRRRWIAHASGPSSRSFAHAAWAMLGAYLGVLLVIAAIVLLGRILFFHSNIWINPAPIAFGMGIKFLLAGTSPGDAAPQGRAVAHPQTRPLLASVLWWGALCASLAAVAYTVWHASGGH